MSRHTLCLIAVGLTLVGGMALALFNSGVVVPSLIRDPLSIFVQPGVSIWWLVFGGPFRNLPDSAAGIVFAAVANAALWSLALWVMVVAGRALRRRAATFRS